MKMEIVEPGDDIMNVPLIGRLDTPGVAKIENRLTDTLVPRGARAIIDLSQVEFVGSLGIRMFITIAKALARRQGKLVLYAPRPLVQQVFETTSLHDIVPISADADAAAAVARG
jgi:anti-anti-sigma factor